MTAQPYRFDYNPMQIGQYIQNGVEQGFQKGQERKLNNLAAQAYSDPMNASGAIQQAIATDSDYGQKLAHWNDQQKQDFMQKAAGAAQYLINAKESGNPQAVQGAYQSVKPWLQKLGDIHGGNVPDQWDDSMLPSLHQIVANAGGNLASPESEQFTLSPGSARYDKNGKVIASQPFQDKPSKWHITTVKTPNGGEAQVFIDPETMEMRGLNGQVIYRGSVTQSAEKQAASEAGNPLAVQGGDLVSGVGSVISPLGGRITSTTGGHHNAGSLHYSGNAVDVGMGQESPEKQQQIIAALQAAGYTVRDERTRPPGQAVWGGPHVHVEAGGKGATQIASAGGVNWSSLPGYSAPDIGADNQDTGGKLGDAAIDNAATRYNITGTLPPLGMGKDAAALRSRILERAAEIAKAQGLSATDLATQPGDYKNDQASLKGLQQSSAAMARATDALHSNAQLLLDQSKKVFGGSFTGTQPENSLRLSYGRVTNDPDVRAYDNYVQTVINEYAKIIGGAPGSNAAATEGASQRAAEAIHKASSPEALKATIEALYKEAENFRNSNDAQISRIKSSRIVGGSQPAGSEATTNGDRTSQVLKLLNEARDAIRQGADKEAVKQRLIQQGLTNIAGRL